MREAGVRPGFWITILAAVLIVVFAVRGQWEWAVVALIAALVFTRLPFVRWPEPPGPRRSLAWRLGKVVRRLQKRRE